MCYFGLAALRGQNSVRLRAPQGKLRTVWTTRLNSSVPGENNYKTPSPSLHCRRCDPLIVHSCFAAHSDGEKHRHPNCGGGEWRPRPAIRRTRSRKIVAIKGMASLCRSRNSDCSCRSPRQRRRPGVDEKSLRPREWNCDGIHWVVQDLESRNIAVPSGHQHPQHPAFGREQQLHAGSCGAYQSRSRPCACCWEMARYRNAFFEEPGLD